MTFQRKFSKFKELLCVVLEKSKIKFSDNYLTFISLIVYNHDIFMMHKLIFLPLFQQKLSTLILFLFLTITVIAKVKNKIWMLFKRSLCQGVCSICCATLENHLTQHVQFWYCCWFQEKIYMSISFFTYHSLWVNIKHLI